MKKWIQFYRRRWHGPTTEEKYGLSEVEHDMLEDYRRARMLGYLFDDYTTRLMQEWMERQDEAFHWFSQNGWYRGWEQRVKKEIFG